MPSGATQLITFKYDVSSILSHTQIILSANVSSVGHESTTADNRVENVIKFREFAEIEIMG